MTVPLPFTTIPRRVGLGVGMDLPWGEAIGLVRGFGEPDCAAPRVLRFLERYGERFSHIFFAFQPRGREVLCAEDYFAAYDSLFAAAPGISVRAMHHTLLNMGGLDDYARDTIAEFTNALVRRYGLQWIVEDIGIWSMRGKVMPYPLPPLLTADGLAACVRNVQAWRDRLLAPLSIEFPGFTDGSNFVVGTLDAFTFFRGIAEAADVAVTLDVGHILSYQWLRGRRGPALYEDLDALPLDRCFELHLSGCAVIDDKFRDLHHGILLDEQITLLERMLPLCPNLRCVTYEDPRYDNEGVLVPRAVANFERLARTVEAWAA